MSYETIGEAISKMLDNCLELGSKDNMTMLVVPLEAMPLYNSLRIIIRPTEEKINKRKEMEAQQAEAEKHKEEEKAVEENPVSMS